MNEPTGQPISNTNGLGARANSDARPVQGPVGIRDNTIHGIHTFTVPRADGTLEIGSDVQANGPQTATARMIRRRQGEMSQGDQDGDGNYTNSQGYRDGRIDGRGNQHSNHDNSHHHLGTNADRHGFTTSSKSGLTVRRPLSQRVRKAFIPTILGLLIGWYYDAVDVLIYRRDPRIRGNFLTFSLLCWVIMLSIFFYLEFIRPVLRKKPTEYVNWEKEFLYPIRIATASLVMGSFGSTIALWPVWHLSTFFVLPLIAIAIISVLGVFF